MQIFERNIGVLTPEQQARLGASRVTVIGLGGLGGVIAEILTRSGVGELVLVDFDTFDPSNLNRQVFAFQDTVGRPKTEVTREQLLRINPALRTELASTVDDSNAAALIQGSQAVVLAADDALPCIVASRVARTAGIPVVEGWAIPFCNVRVFTADTPTLEVCYGFPELPDPLGAIAPETRAQLKQCMLFSLARIEGVADYYSEATLERIRAGHIPSFAPVVWLTAVRMALETVKALLGLGTLALAPRFALYDPFADRIPRQEP
jgi:molybdopterin/thiamine biosynthesis adenylyltransferase